ncbi:ABC transporter permease [Halobacteria archaeon AArc-dxtr1]|nr:ABC transporter permease [Halobacteria archaeon AArc-dxtr1]
MLNASVIERLLIATASTGLALLIGLIIVAVAGYDPLQFLNNLIVGAFGDMRSISQTLRFTTLFILAGVAVAVAFRAGVFNIGVQGQLIMGGIACVLSILWLAPFLPNGQVGGVVLMLIGTIAAIVAGGLYGALPGAMKAYAGANEIITTIMLNFIAIGVVGWAVSGPLRPEGTGAVRTERLPDNVGFPTIVSADSSFSVIGLAIALGTVILIYVLMTRTSFGYDMVTSGYQRSAASYSGVDAKQTIVATMTLSGMIAGLAGAVFAIMVQGYYVDPAGIHTYGFDAIAISLLAANNPIGVVPAALLFGGLNGATSTIQIASDVPVQLIEGIVGLVVLFVAAPELFRMIAERTGLGGEKR